MVTPSTFLGFRVQGSSFMVHGSNLNPKALTINSKLQTPTPKRRSAAAGLIALFLFGEQTPPASMQFSPALAILLGGWVVIVLGSTMHLFVPDGCLSSLRL